MVFVIGVNAGFCVRPMRELKEVFKRGTYEKTSEVQPDHSLLSLDIVTDENAGCEVLPKNRWIALLMTSLFGTFQDKNPNAKMSRL